MSKSIEEIVATELYGHRLPPQDWEFIAALRKAAAAGVGYGAMQQYCEWEWRAKDEHGAWGPLSHEKDVDELEPDAERYRWLRDSSGNDIMVALMAEARSDKWDELIDDDRDTDQPNGAPCK